MVERVHQQSTQASQIGLLYMFAQGCTAQHGYISRLVYMMGTPWSCAVHNLGNHVLWSCSQYPSRFQNQGALFKNWRHRLTLEVQYNTGKLTSKLFHFL